MSYRGLLIALLVFAVGFSVQAQDLDDPIPCDEVDAQSLEVDEILILECDEDCADGSIWGTGAYTSDSDVCTAAAHAGVIDAEEGGVFIMYTVPGLDNYVGSELNGIESSDWGSWDMSLTFEPLPIQLEWSDDARIVEGGTGTVFSAICLEDEDFGTVWGTGIYTDDSSVCTAAQHAGVEVDELFYVSIVDGQDGYEGTEANDVETRDYGSWSRSFVITPAVIEIDWSEFVNAFDYPVGTTFVAYCEPEGSLYSLWGTDVYTSDSSICTAAVHSGVITIENGGIFYVTVLEGQEEYESTEANGVESSSWGEYPLSFSVGYFLQDRSEDEE